METKTRIGSILISSFLLLLNSMTFAQSEATFTEKEGLSLSDILSYVAMVVGIIVVMGFAWIMSNKKFTRTTITNRPIIRTTRPRR